MAFAFFMMHLGIVFYAYHEYVHYTSFVNLQVSASLTDCHKLTFRQRLSDTIIAVQPP